VPFGLLLSPSDLLLAELASYPDASSLTPVAGFFTPFHEDPGWRDPRVFFERHFDTPAVREAEETWVAEWKASSLEAMLALGKNFPEPPGGYSGRDSVRFVDLAVEPHLAILHELAAGRVAQGLREHHSPGGSRSGSPSCAHSRTLCR